MFFDRYAPTSSERLMAIEKGRASEELDRLEMSLANMQSSVSHSTRL